VNVAKIFVFVFIIFLYHPLQGWWKEVPYGKTFSLKGGSLAAGKGNDLWAAARKGEGKDLFLVKWDEDKNDWVQKSEKPIWYLTASSDGAVFVARVERDGEKDFWHIVRFFPGKEKDIGKWSTKGPSGVQDLSILRIAARNKNELWCTFKEQDSIEFDGRLRTARYRIPIVFTEHWDGSSWKKRTDDRLVIKTKTPFVSVARDGSIFGRHEPAVRHLVGPYRSLPRKKFVKLRKDFWEAPPIRWQTQKIGEVAVTISRVQGQIANFSAIDADNIWFIMAKKDNRNVFKWDGKKMVHKGENKNFSNILAVSEDLIFILGNDGKLYTWTEGKEPISEKQKEVVPKEEFGLWDRVVEWFKIFFLFILNHF